MGVMEGIDRNFEPGAKVRLRKDIDPSVYGDFACVGNEGWIQDQRVDRFGLPEVLMKWDTNHWAYNGVPDCWTFAEHFEPVEDDMDQNNAKEAAQQAALQFANEISRIFSGGGNTENPSASAPADLTSRFASAAREFELGNPKDKYAEAVEAATERLGEADGFIVVGVDREGEIYSPFAFGYSRTPKGELAVQAHLAGVTARAHQDLAIQTIASLSDES